MKPNVSETPISGAKQIGPEKRPAKIDRALHIMWVLWAIGSLYLVGAFVFGATGGTIETNILVSLGLLYLLVIVMLAFLIRAVSSGKNWARVTYGVLASLSSILIVLANLFSARINLPKSIISLLFVAAYISVIWILFQRASTDWFRQMSETYNTFESEDSNLDDSDSGIPEPKKLRTFTIVVLTMYVFLFLMGVSRSYFSIEGTENIVKAIQGTFLLVFIALTLFTFVKRNQL